MLEADLKRWLVKSCRAQGGIGHRFEDKYAVGFPDLLLIPRGGFIYFPEAKILSGNVLNCTPKQADWIRELNSRTAACRSLIVAYHPKDGILYAGLPTAIRSACTFVRRPARLDSADWPITALLNAWVSQAYENNLTRLTIPDTPRAQLRKSP